MYMYHRFMWKALELEVRLKKHVRAHTYTEKRFLKQNVNFRMLIKRYTSQENASFGKKDQLNNGDIMQL